MTKPHNPKPKRAPKAHKAAQPAAALEKPIEEASVPGAVINRRAADRLRAGHLWVYASDVESIAPPKPEETLLPVADNRGIFLGTALYSPSSQIALRLVSRRRSMKPDGSSCSSRACARPSPAVNRCSMPQTTPAAFASARPTSCPAWSSTSTASLVILQFLTKGLLAAGVKEACVRVLREELNPAAILERPDPRIRELEGLPPPNPDPLWLADPAQPVTSHAVPSQRPRFSLRRQRRPKDRRVSRSAHQLRSRTRMGSAALRGEIQLSEIRFPGPCARCLLLPGRFCPASRAGLPPGDGHRRLSRLARSGGAQSRSQSLAHHPPMSTGSRLTPSRFFATGRKRG